MSSPNNENPKLVEVKEYLMALTEGIAPKKDMQQVNEYF